MCRIADERRCLRSDRGQRGQLLPCNGRRARGGLDGTARELKPGEPVNIDTYKVSERTRRPRAPAAVTLGEAIDAFERSDFHRRSSARNRTRPCRVQARRMAGVQRSRHRVGAGQVPAPVVRGDR